MALAAFALATGNVAHASEDFDRGYELGWKEGYKKGQGQFALPPLCPLPPLGEDTFFGGYNEGFLAGMAEAEGE
jgi:hypothetical protein